MQGLCGKTTLILNQGDKKQVLSTQSTIVQGPEHCEARSSDTENNLTCAKREATNHNVFKIIILMNISNIHHVSITIRDESSHQSLPKTQATLINKSTCFLVWWSIKSYFVKYIIAT